MNIITKLRLAFFGKPQVYTTGIVCVQLQYLLSNIIASVLPPDVFRAYATFKMQIDKAAAANIDATAFLMQQYGVSTIVNNSWQYETHIKAAEIAQKLMAINSTPVNLDGNMFSPEQFNAFISNKHESVIYSMDQVVFLSQFLLQKS